MTADKAALAAGISLACNAHGRDFIHVRHPAVEARIALEGAHLAACTPSGQPPLLWMSPTEPALPGKPLRGGVPLCWPWFGGDRPGPAHGIARTSRWQLDDVQTDPDQVRLRLSLPPAEIARHLPEGNWQLGVEFVLGRHLSIALTTTNTGDQPQVLSQALHAYLPVGDIEPARLQGLDGCMYIDKVIGSADNVQVGSVAFGPEVDRIYHGHAGPVQLTDDTAAPIIVSREGSRSLVVWNPGKAKSASLSHFPPDGYRTMVCIEAANAGPDARLLAAGESHTLRTRIRRE
ncbi:MAG: D-hexose-6-phosphate mutarotase [Aquisalimonadaceae bacterium]